MLNKQIYTILFLLLLVCTPAAAQSKARKAAPKQSAPKTVAEPAVATDSAGLALQDEKIRQLMATYKFDEAERQLQATVKALTRRKQSTTRYEEELATVRRAKSMLGGTQKVLFVDSFVVDAAAAIAAIRVSKPAMLMTTAALAQITRSAYATEGTAYYNEFTRKAYLPIADGDNKRLAATAHLGDAWTSPEPLQGLEGDLSQDFPFVLSDGTTLYYAAQGDRSIGGYDIFVTRYNRSSGQYLQAENIGMPFNSPANDYLYVIDEESQLGWFVTDRNQPMGKVCIYVFVPNAQRNLITDEGVQGEALADAARIANIALSQSDKAALAAAKQRLKNIMTAPAGHQTVALQFILNDSRVLNAEADFRSPQSYQQALKWQELKVAEQDLHQTLQKAYDLYTQSTNKAMLRDNILKLEQEYYRLQQNIKNLELNIRKLELTQ